MSFILDALKKLEQQRQKGSVPDLLTVHSSEMQKPVKRTVRPYMLLAALLLTAGIVAAFFLLRGSDEPVVTAGGHLPERGPDSEQNFALRKEPSPPAASPDEGIRIKSAEHGSTKQTALSEIRTAETVTESPYDSSAVLPGSDHENPSESVTDGAAEIPDDLSEEEPASVDRIASLNLRPTDQELDSLRTQIKEEQESVISSAPSDPSPVKEEEPEEVNTLSDISELPPDVRKELPDISISGHIYSNIPGSRVATINGAIVRQGEDVTKGLKVDEITLSGVIFTYRGFRFYVRAF